MRKTTICTRKIFGFLLDGKEIGLRDRGSAGGSWPGKAVNNYNDKNPSVC